MKQIFGRCLEVVAVNRKEKRSIQAQASEEKRSGGEGRLGVGSAIKDKREKHMRELRAYEDMCIDDALLCVSFAKFFLLVVEWCCYQGLDLLKRTDLAEEESLHLSLIAQESLPWTTATRQIMPKRLQTVWHSCTREISRRHLEATFQ